MKKSIIICITLTLLVMAIIPFASPVYADPANLVAGNDVIDRVTSSGDSWTDFYLVDTTNPFNADGRATEWKIYAGKLVPVQLVLYRNTASVWSVVGTSTVENPTIGENTVSSQRNGTLF